MKYTKFLWPLWLAVIGGVLLLPQHLLAAPLGAVVQTWNHDPQAPPPQLGVTIQTATYDPVKQELAVRFYNSSKRDATAYHFTIRIDYADGTSQLEDRGSELAVDPTYRGFLLLAGTTSDEKLYDELQPKKVTRIVGFVDMVAYDDGTAEAVNETAFNRLVESRKARAVASQKVNEILKRSLSAANPGEAALSELQRLKKVYAAKDRPDPQDAAMLVQLHVALQNLGQVQRGPLTSDQLQEHIKQRDEGLAAMKFHSELKRIGGWRIL